MMPQQGSGLDPRRIRRLQRPDPIEVRFDSEGTPTAVKLRARWVPVQLARKPWRIDQHWWRSDQVARTYYRLDPGDAPLFTVFRDDITGEWFRQEYSGQTR